MPICFLSKLYFLEIVPEAQFSENPLFKISSRVNEALSQFDTPEIVHKIGTLNFGTLMNAKTWIYHTDAPVFSRDLEENGEVISGTILPLFNAFWLVKDSSVYPGLYSFHDTETGYTITISRDVYFSNASGNYELTSFDQEELKAVEIWLDFLFYILQGNQNVTAEINEGVRRNATNLLPHPEERLKRVFLFLSEARSTSNIYKKVTFYVAMLESLFATEEINAETSRSVARRSLAFLFNFTGDKDAFLTLIRDAYKVRSRYIHGDNVDIQQENVYQISKSIDDVLRLSIHEIFIKNHLDLFNGHRRTLRRWLNAEVERLNL